MIATQRDVRKYLREKKLFSSFKILGMKSGLSNCNYILETEKGRFVLRTNKIKPSKSTNNLIDENNVLKFFEEYHFDFVPKSFYYDAENNVHILTYIEGRKIRFKNISRKGLEQAIDKLYQINLLAKEYEQFCEKNGIILKPIKSEVERVKIRVLEKLENVKEDNILYDIKEWILEKLEEDFKNYHIDKTKVYLNHGDPADNLIVNYGKISIIDWEYVRLNYGPGLVHILAHGSLSSEKEELILKYFSKISGESISDLKKKTYIEKNIYYLLKIAKICFKFQDDLAINDRNIEEERKNINKIINNYYKIKKTLAELY